MKLKINEQADALYLTLGEAPASRTEEVSPGIIVEYDEQDRVVGIEMLSLSKRAPQTDIRRFLFEACRECNGGFSLDEEYLACLLECVMAGTTETDGLAREKVKRALLRNPRLTAQLDACRWDDLFGRPWWRPDEARVRNVVSKLAKGHAAYELSESWHDEPDAYLVRAIPAMLEAERQEFECIGGEAQCSWPELGSRAFLRALGKSVPPAQVGAWLIVQPGRYRYSVDWQTGIDVRMVIGEYLACRVVWNR